MLGNKTYLTLCSILALKSLHVTCFTSFPPPNAFAKNTVTTKLQMRKNEQHEDTLKRSLAAISASLVISSSLLFGNAYAATPASEAAKYDGFAEYAKENQMEKSDVDVFSTSAVIKQKLCFQILGELRVQPALEDAKVNNHAPHVVLQSLVLRT